MGGALQQEANVLPPRRGQCLALTVDTTARAYDISGLALGGHTPPGSNSGPSYVFVTMQAITQDVWLHFHSASATDLDNAAVITAGSALAYANTYGYRIPAGGERRFRLNRAVDKFLVVETSTSTATLLIAASSEGF